MLSNDNAGVKRRYTFLMAERNAPAHPSRTLRLTIEAENLLQAEVVAQAEQAEYRIVYLIKVEP